MSLRSHFFSRHAGHPTPIRKLVDKVEATLTNFIDDRLTTQLASRRDDSRRPVLDWHAR